jgi:hypothetical protein
LPPRRAAYAVFLAAFAYVFWTAASRFVLSSDEGIYLASGLRILHGEVPYRDFFLFTGPGTPLIQSLLLRWCGEKLWAARVPLSVDLGVLTAVLFWLVDRLATRAAALLAAACFLAFETADASRLVADHRWDSAASATLAIALTVSLLDHPSRVRAVLAGALAALAAWITPPLALVAAVILVAARAEFSSVIVGAGACSAIFAVWIAAHGAIRATIDGLLWPATHYIGANRTSYGSVTGGYANLLHVDGAGEWIVTILLLASLTLPASLPPLSAIAWPLRLKSQPPENRTIVLFLLASIAALVMGTLPRPDLNHLTNVAAPAYALGAAWIARTLPKPAALGIAAMFFVLAAADYSIAIQRRLAEPSIETRVGKLRGPADDLDTLEFVESQIPPQDTFFAFPYLPNFYFVTGASNPTRFSYLQPGMFSADEERQALAELEASPPDRILYVDVPPAAYQRMWPGSDPSRLRFPAIEQFIAARYRPLARHGAYRLLAPLAP